MENRFWSNKNYVEDWLSFTDIEFSAKTIGKGNRGVLLYIHSNISIQDFIQKYSGSESKYASFYMTTNRYTNGLPIYVSISKFGYNYGSNIIRKAKNENRIK